MAPQEILCGTNEFWIASCGQCLTFAFSRIETAPAFFKFFRCRDIRFIFDVYLMRFQPLMPLLEGVIYCRRNQVAIITIKGQKQRLRMNRKKMVLFGDFFFTSQKGETMKSIIFLFISGLLLNGCYSNKSVIGRRNTEGYLYTINELVKNKTAQVELVTGEIFTGKSITVSQDSTFWQDTETGLPRSVETSYIKGISIKRGNALKGLGGGFLIGAAMGGTLGLLIGVDDCTGEDQICFERGSIVLPGAVLLGVPFGLIGLVTGASIQTSLTYQFVQEKN